MHHIETRTLSLITYFTLGPACSSSPPALIAFLAPLFLFGYQLTRTRHAEIIAALDARKSGAA